jgi:hypothetical protein
VSKMLGTGMPLAIAPLVWLTFMHPSPPTPKEPLNSTFFSWNGATGVAVQILADTLVFIAAPVMLFVTGDLCVRAVRKPSSTLWFKFIFLLFLGLAPAVSWSLFCVQSQQCTYANWLLAAPQYPRARAVENLVTLQVLLPAAKQRTNWSLPARAENMLDLSLWSSTNTSLAMPLDWSLSGDIRAACIPIRFPPTTKAPFVALLDISHSACVSCARAFRAVAAGADAILVNRYMSHWERQNSKESDGSVYFWLNDTACFRQSTVGGKVQTTRLRVPILIVDNDVHDDLKRLVQAGETVRVQLLRAGFDWNVTLSWSYKLILGPLVSLLFFATIASCWLNWSGQENKLLLRDRAFKVALLSPIQ